ncbi:SDR family oxidoreductase [Nocardioides dongkuii]|uniref:SDR family oxidoreductase n=1 Tax=Nocardioides dongkuii TaxID=2760089 RepID=UPI001FD2168A|nr:SDR family oxidoreductase [Nocardioides dongkuii]
MTDPHLTASMAERPDHGEDSYEGHGRLRDKVAVVTGGDSGIGRAVTLAFAREGADVVICYLESDEEDAQETAELVRQAGREILLVPTDLTEERACRDLVDRTVAEHGRIDVLVNNAAHQLAQPGGIADITTEQFDRTMRTNLYAMFWLCKLALPHMPRGSSIINTSSVQASSPSPELLDYATTKAGIATFTRALAWSAAQQGIRVNSVAPGPTWTPLVRATMPEEMVEHFGENTPMGRAGQPVEVAGAFVYLASAESAYVTGEVLAVTGGLPVIT